MNFPNWAFVGAKVVCVNDDFDIINQGYGTEIYPVNGPIYTIREIGIIHPFESAICVRLVEIVNLVKEYSGPVKPDVFYEPCFGLHRFKPVITLEEDMKIFTEILNTIKIEETV